MKIIALDNNSNWNKLCFINWNTDGVHTVSKWTVSSEYIKAFLKKKEKSIE